MSITEEHPTDEFEQEDAPEPARLPGSVLDHVRARRDQLASRGAGEKVFEVPGTAMGVRCRYPEAGADAIVRTFEQAQQRGRQSETVAAAARLLALCCAEIVGRVPGGDWEPLDESDQPLRFTRRLADLLGFEVPEDGHAKPSAITRHIVRHVFSPTAQSAGVYEGDIALLDKAGGLAEWLRTGLRDVTEDLEGE